MSPLETPPNGFRERLELAGIEAWPALGRPLDAGWSNLSLSEVRIARRAEFPASVVPLANAAEEQDSGQISDLPLQADPWLVWRIDDARMGGGSGLDLEGLLDEFIGLRRAPDEEIEAFVSSFGPFGFCPHGRTEEHIDCVRVQWEEEDGSEWFAEPLDGYRRYAWRFEAILGAQADITEYGEIRDYSLDIAFSGQDYLDNLEALQETWEAKTDQSILDLAVNLLLQEDPVALGYYRSVDGQPHFALVTGTLGILAYQLASALQGGIFAVCTNCRTPYAPRRRPQPGRDSYCAACRDARKAAYKRRQRSKRAQRERD